LQGFTGASGEKGSIGNAGQVGIQGQVGATGTPGQRGQQGTPGDTGASGPTGMCSTVLFLFLFLGHLLVQLHAAFVSCRHTCFVFLCYILFILVANKFDLI